MQRKGNICSWLTFVFERINLSFSFGCELVYVFSLLLVSSFIFQVKFIYLWSESETCVCFRLLLSVSVTLQLMLIEAVKREKLLMFKICFWRNEICLFLAEVWPVIAEISQDTFKDWTNMISSYKERWWLTLFSFESVNSTFPNQN